MIDQETFDKSRVYQLDKSSFSLVHDLFKQLEFLVRGANDTCTDDSIVQYSVQCS